MPGRESAHENGRSYLAEGRLIVDRVDELGIRARCRGGGAEYVLGHDGDGWWCTCPARTCSAHLVALQLVAVRRNEDGP